MPLDSEARVPGNDRHGTGQERRNDQRRPNRNPELHGQKGGDVGPYAHKPRLRDRHVTYKPLRQILALCQHNPN